MNKCTLLLMSTFMFAFRLIGQEAPKIRFEKVSQDEMSMKTYPNDTTADAVILFDNGTSFVNYDLEEGFMLTYERFVRIKILKQKGIEWGNFNIPLYYYGDNRENLVLVKGTTFNMESEKVVKSELKKDAIFKERENKYIEVVRLSMPSVKVGSVIDLKYQINTNLIWNLRPWQFQYTIPVNWSQYQVVYPEYFTYNHSMIGYHPLLYSKTSQKIENINYVAKSDYIKNSDFNPANHSDNKSISYLKQVFDYAANNIPAMKREPYLTTLDNYTTQVKFELANTNFIKVGGQTKNYTTSWTDIAKQLAQDENFGEQLKGVNFTEDAVDQLTRETIDTIVKLSSIYDFVQHTIKWNGHKSAFTTKSLKKTYSEKTGNSADINLLLTAMLKKAGINAFPVVLSTRENGILSFTHATISDCNYVIVQAIVDGKPILLDATEPNLQEGYLPFRCLNGEGHLIGNEESKPVSLVNPKSIENAMVQLEIKDGKVTGTIEKRIMGLGAFNFRESVKSSGGKQEYFEKIKNSSSEFDYLEYKFGNLDSLSQPVNIKYKIAIKERQEGDAAIIYIDPQLISDHKHNPFTSPTREYPVDFGSTFTEGYTMRLTIPEGYAVEELPKSQVIALEGKGGIFSYQVAQLDNKVIINQRFTIDKTQFTPSEYQGLKDFYDLVVNKLAEQIILKRKPI